MRPVTGIVTGLCFAKTTSHHKHTMSKHHPVNKAPARLEPAELDNVMPSASLDPAAAPSFWLLKDASARKIGKRSEGTITYRLLADVDLRCLFIELTSNQKSGYFSRERVPFQKIRECLNSFPGKPFPSKALRDAFFGRSSNNPSFLAAALADCSLIAGDMTIESQHKAIGDWSAWEKTMLALPGTLIQAEAAQALPDPDDAMPDHTQTVDAKEVQPAKSRKGGKHTTEASHAGDTSSE